MDFSFFDVRKYQTLDVSLGYGEWSKTYDQTVRDEMDLQVFNNLKSICWEQSSPAVDLACGTGRVGVWLKRKGVSEIDGVDLTSEMLAQAQSKGMYRNLVLGDATKTTLPAGKYQLVTCCLADEHFENLTLLYKEAARLLRPGGYFVNLGFHPFFLMNGIPTHFDRPDGTSVAIHSFVHLLSDHFKNGSELMTLQEFDEKIVDQTWIRNYPKLAKYENRPITFAMVWRKN